MDRDHPTFGADGTRADGSGEDGTRTDGSRADSSRAVDFDEVIDDVIDDLPEAFVAQLDSVAIVVEDEPNPDQLSSVRAAGLYGLYQGVPRTRFGVDNVPLPSKITLFRGPLTRSNPDPERLVLAVEDTLLHEIAHHFGIDDARLHALLAEGQASRIARARAASSSPPAHETAHEE